MMPLLCSSEMIIEARQTLRDLSRLEEEGFRL